MKFLKNFLMASLVLVSVNAHAQTVDEIVAKNMTAMGGTEKLSTLNSVKMSGNMSAQGMDFPITITKLQNKGMRMDLEIMGTSNYQIITPDKGYMFFPIQQMTEPKELEGDMLKSLQSGMDVQGSLVNYKAKGSTLSYIGTEQVDGAEAYHLKMTAKSGKVVEYFIDTKTNRVIKTSGKATGPDGNEVDVETTFSDYKQNADGYWFAYATVTPNGPLTYDKIETNITVDENIFKN